MARPRKQNVDYFSHDVHMRNDVKIKALRRKYKHLGYSIYNITLELLGGTEYFQIKWDDVNIELLCSEYDCDYDELVEIINYCVKLELLQIEHGYLHCEKFTKRIEGALMTRREGYCSENSPISQLRRVFVDNNLVSVCNNTQSIVKHSKAYNTTAQDSIEEDSKTQDITGYDTIPKHIKQLVDKLKN